MRFFLFAIVLLNWGCQGGTNNPLLSKADTLKLYDPQPDTALASPLDLFKNCIALRADGSMVVANGIQRQVDAEAPLEQLIAVYADSLKSRKLFILCDTSIAFDRIAATIDLLKAHAIHNYKVVRMDTVTRAAEQVFIKPPSLIPQKVDLNDSAVFMVTVLKKGITLKHAGIVKQAADLDGLEALLQQYPKPTDSTVAVIRGSGNLNGKRVMQVMRLLRQNGYVRVRMVTKE